MDWPRLNTHAWNLSLGALATSVLAGCGPFVILEGETDTDSETDSGPNPTSSNPTEPTESDTLPPPGQCQTAADCQPGEECIDNVCVPYDPYCDSDYCCYDCCYGECYDDECFSDSDCGPMGLCDSLNYSYYQSCLYVPVIEECGTPVLGQLELPSAAEGEVVALAFVDANGDEAADLLVAREGSAHVHVGPDGAFPLPLPLPPGTTVVDAVAGDLDTDGDADIVISTAQGSLLVVTSGGPLGFELATDLFLGSPMREISTLQWNDDGSVDVAGVQDNGQALVVFGDGAGGFTDISSLFTFGLVRSLAPSNFDDNQYSELVAQDDSELVQVFWGDGSANPEPSLYLDGTLHGERRLVSGPLSPFTPHEVIGYTPVSGGWQLLELWVDGGTQRQFFWLPSDATRAELGDVTGDGSQDLVMGGGTSIQYVFSSSDPWFYCHSTLFIGAPVPHFSAGDFDGNGLADVAFASGPSVWVMLTQ